MLLPLYVLGEKMRVTEYLLCRLISTMSTSDAINFLEHCFTRYSSCLATAKEVAASVLRRAGLDVSPDSFKASMAAELLQEMIDTAVERGEGILYTARTTRDLKHLKQLVGNMFVNVALAVADLYGITCPRLKQ